MAAQTSNTVTPSPASTFLQSETPSPSPIPTVIPTETPMPNQIDNIADYFLKYPFITLLIVGLLSIIAAIVNAYIRNYGLMKSTKIQSKKSDE